MRRIHSIPLPSTTVIKPVLKSAMTNAQHPINNNKNKNGRKATAAKFFGAVSGYKNS